MSGSNPRTQADLGAPDVRALSAASALGRAVIGAGLMLAPERSMTLLGFSELGEDSVAIARIAGVRDLVLAASTLLALGDPARLRAASLANAAADGGDAVVFALALSKGSRGPALRGLAAAVPASLSGLWVAWRVRRAA